MDNGVTRRAFVIHMGTAAALLGGAVPVPAQTAPAPVPGKEKLIVRSPRPINLETPFGQLGADITPTELFFVRNNYDGPEIDPSRCDRKLRATLGSNTTGQRQVAIFRAPRRRIVRSPALRPISAGSRRSAA